MPFLGRKKKFYCKKLKKIETNEDNLYVDKIWFQCESETCLKWRVLSNEDASQVDIDESWFCFMNNDQNHNTCSASEEYYPEESYVLKHGFKYVYSQLPIGSLVLVKLYNWPSWPGILCLDPLMGEYMTCDLDGNVEYYHVEFLGNPHSRKWIKANSVGHYSITLKPERCKFNKKWYESALQEAYLLYAFSHEQRLDLCLLSKTGMPLVDTPEANIKAAAKAKKRMKSFKNGNKNKKSIFRKNKRKGFFKYSFEIVCSDDALLKENIVVSETEDILRDLLQMLEEVGEPVKTFGESYAHGNEIHAEGKVSLYNTETSEEILCENQYEEDCLIIDGVSFRTGECIESITDKFKEIDALMSEF
ncbi:zinc finger CW-type PWWP domain protein 2 [Antechinus flavipes]|uniref:zinc finger CW-type PWWP domain protein 2 n=1 Tax=Antechinus flavipes TaxID=38775 RepID=UPI002235B651|nr:zinc finger CW-type PWWP domain protein 2 [Antechinus flavipes]XP_051819429.1 zinc finger CW-type PWWP domain protein 2 [Antechinus flavipes]